jgi:PAS domain S-box-containing protein
MLGYAKNKSAMRVKISALEALRSNVMIADAELNITYMNPSVIALLREAEADLKKELPRFSVATLIGSNIDVFHKNPSHQRRMLGSMEKTHSAMIEVGKRAFDLVITPIFGAGNKRAGFVVEWSDARARLLNVDYAGKIKAVGRSQTMIEFTPTGEILDANDAFLSAFGYRIDEVRGKHHSMFVEPEYRNSPDYAAMWDRLRRGEYIAAQFKRLGKGGKPIWIEGSYNPILDENGKVAKVVKFSTDVSIQNKLLADLKILIDQNFGEIDRAIDQSSSEAGAASRAAGETMNNVQSVAASTEELAASIGEIAQSMARSRTAADQAFGRANQVGESTDKLAAAAQAMNGIVDLIRNIAGQINLLALNATIEAARAGDAGKGFAVVASEVKNLANQSARATEQITKEIDSIQVTSNEVAAALQTIRDAIGEVREYVTATASAVEEQSAVTRNMSESMQSATASVSVVSSSIGEISAAVGQVSQAVTKTKEAAQVLVR